MDSLLRSILRSVPNVRSLPMRRAALEARLGAATDEDAARAVEGMIARAASGDGAARTASIALASATAHGLADGAGSPLARLEPSAAALGLRLAELVATDEAPARRLLPTARLPPVPLAEDLFFSEVPFVWFRGAEGSTALAFGRAWALRTRTLAIGGAARRCEIAARHPSPRFVRRLLAMRELRLREVLEIAARRPSTPELALEVATSDRWLGLVEVREALALNPFTPTPLVAALLPTVSAAALRSTASGACHPRAVELATLLLARARPAPSLAASRAPALGSSLSSR